jgi:hypothetical protein
MHRFGTSLFQRSNLLGELMMLTEFPILQELGAVQLGPIEYQVQRAPREPAVNQCQVTDIDGRPIFAILRREVGWRMFVEKHADQDAAKFADVAGYKDPREGFV